MNNTVEPPKKGHFGGRAFVPFKFQCRCIKVDKIAMIASAEVLPRDKHRSTQRVRKVLYMTGKVTLRLSLSGRFSLLSTQVVGAPLYRACAHTFFNHTHIGSAFLEVDV